MPAISEFIRGLSIWGPIPVGAALAPTFDQVAGIPLVTPYWQPELDRATAVISGIACIAAYALQIRSSMHRRRFVLTVSLIVFAVGFVACGAIYGLKLPEYVNGRLATDAVVYLNRLLYTVTFASLGVALMGVYLLFRRQREPRTVARERPPG